MSADPADSGAGVVHPEGEDAGASAPSSVRAARVVDDGPPGLEPTLGAIRTALDELEYALATAGAARASLTDLGAGLPGDDRVLLAFLKGRLAAPERRLLETLAGISEEQRALQRASAEISLIYERPIHDPTVALARIAAATGPHRTLPVATYVVPARGQRPIRRPVAPVRGREDARGDAGGGFGWLAGLFRPRPAPGTPARPTAPTPAAAPTPVAAAAPEPAAPTPAATEPAAPEPETAWTPVEAGVAAPDFIGASGAAAVTPELEALPEAPDLERALGLDGAPPGPVAPIAPAEVSGIDEPEDGSGTGGSAGSALSSPTSTAAGRSSRPRRPGGRRRGAPGASRRIAGFGLVIVIPAVAAMLVGGGRDAGAAEAGVAGALSTPSVAPATPTPLVTPVPPAGVDPAIVPIGDDHGTAGPPIGTAVPTYGPTGVPSVPPTGGVAGQVAAGSASVVTHGPTDRDVVALTFDDGYAPANVRAIFEMLVREEVKATFFINGYYLSRDPALWKEIAAAGFPVGNHTYYHVDIRTLSPEAIATELKMTSNAWKRVTGTRMIPYFRPPYGAHDAASDAAVAAAGYEHIVLWDASSADTKAGISESQAIAGALSGGPGSIVLLHAGPDITPRILQAIIDGYRERGFEFVTIPELLGS